MTKKNHIETDIAVIGGGLSGLTFADLYGRTGKDIICLDQTPFQNQMSGDDRTTAVSYGSRKILEEAGIWQKVEDKACPIRNIQIFDGYSPVLLNFLSEEAGGKDFGWIVENKDLREACLSRLAELPNIKHFAPAKAVDFNVEKDIARVYLEDGRVIQARLLVGADGRFSGLRDWMDVEIRRRDYRQRAIICVIRHEKPHNNVAVEHFWPQGPFAVLPMCDDEEGRHRSSVVFTEHGPDRESMAHYSDAAFEMALRLKMPESYGEIELASRRLSYRLGLIHAASYIGPRSVLVADAAHGIHPIAGQGLNLGFRDVKTLSDTLTQTGKADPGTPELLETYQRKRRPDNMAMVAVTDALVHLFSNNIPPIRIMRRIGLKAVSKIPMAKRFFMKQAMADR